LGFCFAFFFFFFFFFFFLCGRAFFFSFFSELFFLNNRAIVYILTHTHTHTRIPFYVLNPTFSTCTPKPALLVSQFSPDPFFAGAVSTVALDWNFPEAPNTTVGTLLPSVTWPNDARLVPSEVTPGGESSFVAVPGGFLVPGKSTGAVTIAALKGNNNESTSPPTTTVLTVPKSGFFYHHVEWADCNGDGLLDALTARVNKPLFGGSSAPEWVWLENPGLAGGGTGPSSLDPTFEGPWKEHLIAGPDQFAPDFFFDLERNATDGTPTGYATAATYFGKKIVLYWGGPLAGTGDAAAAPQFQSMVIDDTIGNGYAAAFVDVDGDGVNEIVATNHVSSNYDGALLIPEPVLHRPPAPSWVGGPPEMIAQS
jgi:hypothetical protein